MPREKTVKLSAEKYHALSNLLGGQLEIVYKKKMKKAA